MPVYLQCYSYICYVFLFVFYFNFEMCRILNSMSSLNRIILSDFMFLMPLVINTVCMVIVELCDSVP